MNNNTNTLIIGIDDATKCPCIGSIFVAGVVADQKTINSWKKAGVKDSKCLTRKKREQLAPLIKETAHAFCIQEIEPAQIDNKILNLNEWEMATFLNIMNTLIKNHSPEYAYVDNWEVTPILFWQRLNDMLTRDLKSLIKSGDIDDKRIRSVQIIPEHKADAKYVVVGAASILAKTESDFQYDRYKELYGNFGSGNPGDPATRQFLWTHRHNPLPIIRTSWNTYKVLAQLDRIEDDPLHIRGQQRKNLMPPV